MKNVFNKTLLASALMLGAGYASAAAFQLAEVSSSGLGRAYSGEAAIGDNAAVVATNPALMSRFDRAQVSSGGIFVDSHIHMYGDVSAEVLGVKAAEGSAAQRSVVPGAFVPNLYFVAPVNDKFALGAGMNVNFGLKSEYSDDYLAGVFGGKTDLTAMNLNFSGAYKVTEGLSVGVGVNAIYAKAKVERTAGILSTALTNVATNKDGVQDKVKAAAQQKIVSELMAKGLKPGTEAFAQEAQAAAAASAQRLAGAAALAQRITPSTTITSLQDKAAWAFGWNAGIAYNFNENHRIGLAYHSKVDIDFKDNTALSYAPTGTDAYVGEGGLTLKLPDYWEFSGYHQLTDKFAFHYSYKYTRWSRLQNLHATYNSPIQNARGEWKDEAFHKNEDYKNTSRYAIGATYDFNDQLTLRAGLAYDKSAAPKDHSSASIPDTDRKWFSLGATYRFTPDLSVDFGFAHLRGKKLHFTEQQELGGGLAVVKGNYHSRATANLYGLNMNYSF